MVNIGTCSEEGVKLESVLPKGRGWRGRGKVGDCLDQGERWGGGGAGRNYS